MPLAVVCCDECGLPLRENDACAKIERRDGSTVWWHRACFNSAVKPLDIERMRQALQKPASE